jgi:hypothetical protein
MMLGYEPMLGRFHFLRTIGFDFLCIYVKIELILDFTTNKLLTRTILGIIFFPRKRKPIIMLDGFHQFKNNQFSWLVFTSRISEF